MDEPAPPAPDDALAPGLQVERVVRDDGRQLLLYTWDAEADA